VPHRELPVRPDLEQLRHQAKDLLRAVRARDAEALADFVVFHPDGAVADPRLHDAQLVLARSYRASSWARLVEACELAAAIWRDDVAAVRALVVARPYLRDEHVLIRTNSNWGPPMTYAANLGRDDIIRLLHALGATDLGSARARAVLQGRVSTAAMIHQMMGEPLPPSDAFGGPAYTLSVAGTEFLLALGLRVDGPRACPCPADVVLETDSRNPQAKHAILDLYARHGFVFPDTPTMALHRGRLDLLQAHLARDPGLVNRTFTHEEIYPPEIGCHDEVNATHATPLKGATLLHMCADYDELAIAEWLLARGADPNTRAAVDADGFGGHTALFATVVSQPAFWINYQKRAPDTRMAELFLAHGADVNVRATLRKQLHPGYDDHRLMEYHDVTPLSWGRRFHQPVFVNREVVELIARSGGIE
jgi:hypothetical protein